MLRIKLLGRFNKCKVCGKIMDYPSTYNYIVDENGNIGICHTYCWDQIPRKNVSAAKVEEMMVANKTPIPEIVRERRVPMKTIEVQPKIEITPTKDTEIKPLKVSKPQITAKSIEKKSDKKKNLKEDKE